MTEDRRFEDLCLMVEQESGSGVYPMGHMTETERIRIREASTDAYRCGWNDRSMDQYHREKTLLEKAQSGLSDDLRCLLASGHAFWDGSSLSLNMNDTWAWACSDLPNVPTEQIGEVARLFRTYGFAGLMYWQSCQENNMRSEFKDNNRAIDFVRHEEEIRKETPDSNKRAYREVSYVLGLPERDTK